MSEIIEEDKDFREAIGILKAFIGESLVIMMMHVEKIEKEMEEEKRTCPPHRWPHVKLRVNELCHNHKTLIGMAHHIFYCWWLRCPNFDYMLAEWRKRVKK